MSGWGERGERESERERFIAFISAASIFFYPRSTQSLKKERTEQKRIGHGLASRKTEWYQCPGDKRRETFSFFSGFIEIELTSHTIPLTCTRVLHLPAGSSNLGWKIFRKKIPASSKKQNLNLPFEGNYSCSIYVVFTAISIALTWC